MTDEVPILGGRSKAQHVWAVLEVDSIVRNYFGMLSDQLRGIKINETARRNTLLVELGGRTRDSVEFKQRNISAVLDAMRLPFVEVYPPMGNYQQLLADAVERYLSQRPGFFDIDAAPDEAEAVASATPLEQVFVDPPAPQPPVVSQEIGERLTRLDFSLRDLKNRLTGQSGERFVLELERRRLANADRPDLAHLVEWVSQSLGDGLGYDIRSFNADGTERLIEVKTIALGKNSPFLMTINELEFADANPHRLSVYRVFNFPVAPRVYVLAAPLAAACRVVTAVYRVYPGVSPEADQ